MSTSDEGAERDYLALAQLSVDHRSFVEAVKEAFLLEHGVNKQFEIAELVNLSKGRVSQILKRPGLAESESIANLVNVLRKPKHRRRIVTSWAALYFSEELAEPAVGKLLGREVDERVIKRIDRMIRQRRLREATQLALEALDSVTERELRLRIEDRAYHALQRLDEPGRALGLVRKIAERALEESDRGRQAAAQLMRSRILRGLETTAPEEVFAALSRASELLRTVTSAESPSYMIPTEAIVSVERINATVTFAERNLLKVSEEQLSIWLAQLVTSAKKSHRYQQRAGHLQLAARISLLQGQTFQAQELLEQSFGSGTAKNLNAYEMAGLLQGRILAQTDSPQAAIAYLEKVAENCSATSDLYHRRLVERERAALEASLFPG